MPQDPTGPSRQSLRTCWRGSPANAALRADFRADILLYRGAASAGSPDTEIGLAPNLVREKTPASEMAPIGGNLDPNRSTQEPTPKPESASATRGESNYNLEANELQCGLAPPSSGPPSACSSPAHSRSRLSDCSQNERTDPWGLYGVNDMACPTSSGIFALMARKKADPRR